MTQQSNYYKTLGVDKNATPEEIKKAFKELAMKHHPDKGGDAEKFKEINEAYSVLSDTQKKAQYDNGGRGSNPRSWGNPFDSAFDMGDFFNMHFNMGQRSSARRKGADIKAKLGISLYEMLKGCVKEVTVTYTDSCKVCQGTGALEKKDCGNCKGTGTIQQHFTNSMGTQIRSGPCPDCKGTGFHIVKACPSCSNGRVLNTRKVNINIPPGIGWSATMRVSEQGATGFYGGPNGDLFVELSVAIPDITTLTEEELDLLKGI